MFAEGGAGPVSTGSLAWLANDARCASGAADAMRINAEEGGLAKAGGAVVARRSAKSGESASWLWPVWAASRAAVRVSGRGRAANVDEAPHDCGVRLGWSGCTAYRGGGERWHRASAAPDRLVVAIARFARQASTALAPLPGRPHWRAWMFDVETPRVSRLPERAMPGVARPKTPAPLAHDMVL
jgi:hypothetical protein